ncbi:MAG: hypothetical protein J5907_03000 [Bacteroidales bacterium]|nr:hypothetical protein [Bacteroidales bacterium]
MRKIALYYSIAFGLLAAGCAKEIEIPEVSQGESDTIELNLRILDSKTRVGKDGVKDGVSEYNENALGGYLDVFFYANNADLDTPALESVRASINPNTARVSIPTSAPAIRTIFGGTTAGRTCKVFVVANYNGTTPMSDIHSRAEKYSRSELNKLVLAQATWSDICDAVDGTFTPGDTPNFVMTGEATLESRGIDAAPVVSGEISVSRIASKVTFSMNVKDTINVYVYSVDYKGNRIKIIDPDTGEWTGDYERKKVTMKPSKDAMVVNLCYANNYAELSGESYVTEETDDPHLFDYKYRPLVQSDGTYKAQPFYSYPQDWGTGAANQPYLKLKIPWTPIDENNNAGSTKEYYYKIPLPEGELKRNNWYQIGLDVSILGGEEQEPIPVQIKYCVAPWVAESESEASVVSSRYLSVARKSYILYNTENLSIPMATSHPVEIVDITISKPYYGTGTAPSFDADDIQRLEPNNRSDAILFQHDIDNNINSSGFDCTPYTISFTIRHIDKHDYSTNISILQYPALYIIPEENYDYSRDGDRSNQHKGYVLVNNSTNTWGGVHGLTTTAKNQNKDMYIINVTRLEAGSEYIIGDARQDVVASYDPYPAFVQAPSVQGSRRSLLYYYPTEESGRTINMVSPSFRVASSYGVTNAISREEARYRCASYQEDQYPAGRWRVPTKAEIAYIANLSSKKVIPILFNPNGTYWSANGLIRVSDSGGTISDATGNSAYVRCVYDEWYWSKKDSEGTETNVCPRGTFTWGDQPR